MLKLKQNKGITLVALIITIIVMLILVGVTVNMALNGGIFDQGNDAATKTEKETIYEQVAMAMTLRDDGKINIDETYSKTKSALEEQGLKVSAMKGGMFTVEGKRGTYTYTITETQILKDSDNNNVSAYKFYGTDEAYMAFTPDGIWLNADDEKIEFKTKAKEEFLNSEDFNNLPDNVKEEIQLGFTQMEQAYGEVTTLLFVVEDGEVSPTPMGFITDGSKVYIVIEGVIELEENEELKNKLVKKKSGLKVFSLNGELSGSGTSLSTMELIAIVDKTQNLFSINIAASNKIAPIMDGIATITKNDKDIKIIVEGKETIISKGADKILLTVKNYGDGPYSGENKYVCFIQDDILYLENFNEEDNFDGIASEGEEFAKMINVTDYSQLSNLGIYLED